MKKIMLNIIVLIMLAIALINQMAGGELLITVGLLWFSHAFRSIADIMQ